MLLSPQITLFRESLKDIFHLRDFLSLSLQSDNNGMVCFGPKSAFRPLLTPLKHLLLARCITMKAFGHLIKTPPLYCQNWNDWRKRAVLSPVGRPKRVFFRGYTGLRFGPPGIRRKLNSLCFGLSAEVALLPKCKNILLSTIYLLLQNTFCQQILKRADRLQKRVHFQLYLEKGFWRPPFWTLPKETPLLRPLLDPSGACVTLCITPDIL